MWNVILKLHNSHWKKKKDFPLSWSRKLFVLLALRKAGALSFSVFLSSSTCSDCVTAGVETCQMGVCTNVYNPINYKDTHRSSVAKYHLNETFEEALRHLLMSPVVVLASKRCRSICLNRQIYCLCHSVNFDFFR